MVAVGGHLLVVDLSNMSVTSLEAPLAIVVVGM